MASPTPTPRRRIASGSPYEPVVGFSRALRVGDRVLVAHGQATLAMRALDARPRLGINLNLDPVTPASADPADWEAVGRAHGAVFAETRPTSTMVVVAALLDPRWRVEMEAEALVG